jgi:hypothetical protein
MRPKNLQVLMAAILVFGFALTVAAITTVEVQVVCPICHTKNQFYDYASWGSYISGCSL